MTRPARIHVNPGRFLRHVPPGVVYVGPGSAWANPYRLDDNHKPYSGLPWGSRERKLAWVEHYRRMAEQGFVTVPYTRVDYPDGRTSFGAHRPQQVAHELKGKVLACTCGADQPCHADLLIEWANP
jgi:hypothetical protein